MNEWRFMGVTVRFESPRAMTFKSVVDSLFRGFKVYLFVIYGLAAIGIGVAIIEALAAPG